MYSKGEKVEKNYFIYVKAILRGLALSLLMLFIAAAIFYFGDFSDSYLGLAAWVITVIAICYSGIYTSMKIGSKGLIHGLLIGFIFVLVLMGIALIAEKGEIKLGSYIVMFIVGIAIGGLSGIIGNLINKG